MYICIYLFVYVCMHMCMFMFNIAVCTQLHAPPRLTGLLGIHAHVQKHTPHAHNPQANTPHAHTPHTDTPHTRTPHTKLNKSQFTHTHKSQTHTFVAYHAYMLAYMRAYQLKCAHIYILHITMARHID